MDESGTPPSDPSTKSDAPEPAAAPEPDTPLPTAGTTPAGASPEPAPGEAAGHGTPPPVGPARPPAALATATPPTAAQVAAAAHRARADTERKRRAWEARRHQSAEARQAIEGQLQEAERLAQGTAGLRKAEGLLSRVRTALDDERPDSPSRFLVGPDRRACWDLWRRVRSTVKQARGRQQELDLRALSDPIAETAECARSGDAFEALRRVKELQARLGHAGLERGQFEELRRRLSEAWQAAQTRVTAERRERSAHREEWRARMEGHLARWRGTIEQKRGQREHLLQQGAKLEGMQKDARSEDFAVKVRGWLQENAEKLHRTEASIAELEERVRTTVKRLGGRSAGAGAGGVRATEPPRAPDPQGGSSPGPEGHVPPDPIEAS